MERQVKRMISHIYQQSQFGEDWFNFPEVYRNFVQEIPNNGHIIEIGSWKGKSAAFLAVEIANSGKNIRLDCIDTWLGSPNESYHQNDIYVKNNELYELFLRNIEPIKNYINVIRMNSIDAAKFYSNSSIDIVFIDACHDYTCVRDDINTWMPKVKNGGILSGHDYCPDHWHGVKQAVDEILGVDNFKVHQTCWIYKK